MKNKHTITNNITTEKVTLSLYPNYFWTAIICTSLFGFFWVINTLIKVYGK